MFSRSWVALLHLHCLNLHYSYPVFLLPSLEAENSDSKPNSSIKSFAALQCLTTRFAARQCLTMKPTLIRNEERPNSRAAFQDLGNKWFPSVTCPEQKCCERQEKNNLRHVMWFSNHCIGPNYPILSFNVCTGLKQSYTSFHTSVAHRILPICKAHNISQHNTLLACRSAV